MPAAPQEAPAQAPELAAPSWELLLAASDDEARALHPRQRCAGRRRAAAIVLASLLGVAALMGLAATAAQRRGPHAKAADAAGGTTGLSTMGSMVKVLGSMAEGIRAAADVTHKVETTYKNMSTMYDHFGDIKHELYHESNTLNKDIQSHFAADIRQKLKGMNKTEKAAFLQKVKKKLNITSWHRLHPKANLTDGNVCLDDEEQEPNPGSLCYKKCSLLTNGDYRFRASAFTCCDHAPPCTAGHMRSSTGMCSGFSVAGDSMGGGCPHSPGGCLKNEELFENTCYKKCILLSFGQLPYRVAAASCCKTNSRSAFIFLAGCDTASTYTVGGGKHDGDKNTPNVPHPPLLSMTETEAQA